MCRPKATRRFAFVGVEHAARSGQFETEARDYASLDRHGHVGVVPGAVRRQVVLEKAVLRDVGFVEVFVAVNPMAQAFRSTRQGASTARINQLVVADVAEHRVAQIRAATVQAEQAAGAQIQRVKYHCARAERCLHAVECHVPIGLTGGGAVEARHEAVEGAVVHGLFGAQSGRDDADRRIACPLLGILNEDAVGRPHHSCREVFLTASVGKTRRRNHR